MTYIYFYLSKTVTCIIHSVHLFYNFSHLYFIGISSLLQGPPPQPRFKIGSVFRQLVKTTCTQVIFCNSGWQRGMGVVEDKLFSLITDLISWVKPPFPLFSPFTIYTIWVIKYFILIIVKFTDFFKINFLNYVFIFTPSFQSFILTVVPIASLLLFMSWDNRTLKNMCLLTPSVNDWQSCQNICQSQTPENICLSFCLFLSFFVCLCVFFLWSCQLVGS